MIKKENYKNIERLEFKMKKYAEVTLINYDGEEKLYTMCLGSRELIAFEDIYGELSGTEQTLFESMDKIKKGDLKSLMALASATLHETTPQGITKKQPLGFDKFDDEIPLMLNMSAIQEGFQQVMRDLQVKSDKSDNVGK